MATRFKDWCDAQLSRVTMYRLVTLCLIALLAVAGLLSLAGYLSFPLTSLALGIAILLATVYGSSRLFGWIFGVRPHGESSIITALILACLFLPPATIEGCVKLAIVGLIATASKYLLSVRGRHIFNPAAVAAVIVSLVGLVGSAWWIATAALLPVVTVVAFLILYKTKRLQMGLLFMGVALLAVTAQSMALLGSSFGLAFWMALTTWPIVFLGGVMLSEPLTQPPHRWQQFSMALLVAVLLAIPLHTSVITMTPALALVIGDGVAWYWGARRGLRLQFVERKTLTPSSYEFIFSGTVPFIAGQYIELTLPHRAADSRGMRRTFTIATSPGDKNIRFGIKIPEHSSTFKQALVALRKDAIVQATRVAGDFTLPQNTKEPLLFVAGGIGITPLISFVRSRPQQDIILLYAVSSPAEIAYRDVLAVSGIKVIVVVPGGKAEVPGGWTVVDAPFVSAEVLGKVKDIATRTVYISGPPLMVNAVKRLAMQQGAKHVKTDHFAGY